MDVTNRVYDTGFPFRIIRNSNYIKSFKNIDKFDINEFLAKLSRKLHGGCEFKALEIAPEFKKLTIDIIDTDKPCKIKILHFNTISGKGSFIRKRKVTKRLMKELELWWYLYNLRKCCSQDPIDIEKLENMLLDDVLWHYTLGDDILEIIYDAVEKIPNHENLFIWGHLNDMRTILREMPKDIEKKEYFL